MLCRFIRDRVHFLEQFGSLLQAAGVGLGYSWESFGLLFLATSTFYFATWETYHTKVLYLGYISGPSEGVVISCTVFMISAFLGPGFWSSRLTDVIPASVPLLQSLGLPSHLTIMNCLYGFMIFLLFTTQLPMRYINRLIKKHVSRRGDMSSQRQKYSGSMESNASVSRAHCIFFSLACISVFNRHETTHDPLVLGRGYSLCTHVCE